MKNEFKAGDLVFVVDTSNSVRLGEFIESYGSKASLIEDFRTGESYFGFGYAATPENHKALGVLYGEGMVPALPLKGSELTKVILKKQHYVLCFISDKGDVSARESKSLRVVSKYENGWFHIADSTAIYRYAVPVDNMGNEIMEIELC